MNHEARHSYRWGAATAALLLIFCSWYPPIQDLANEQTDAGLKRAVITFASARTLNGLISVVQGTEVSVTPLGVGLTLTVGQILDPINDLVEQFSSLMLFASVAFGVQKLLLAIGGHWAVSGIVTVVAVLWAALCFTGRRQPWLTKLVVILLMIRLAIPVATIGSDFVFDKLLSADYQAGQESLLSTSKRLETLAPEASKAAARAEPGAKEKDDKGLVDRFEESVQGLRKSVPKLPGIDVEAIKRAAEDLPEKIIRLIVVFLMQTVALPLLLVWGLYAVVLGAGAALNASVGRTMPRNHPR